LNNERLVSRQSRDELIQTEKQLRMIDIDLKQLTSNYQQLSKQSIENAACEEQHRIEFDNDRQQWIRSRTQFELDIHQLKIDNDELTVQLRQHQETIERITSKLADCEEQLEGRTSFSCSFVLIIHIHQCFSIFVLVFSFFLSSCFEQVTNKFSKLYRTQMDDYQNEHIDLVDQLRQIHDER
jgi:hypothetical protein